MPDFRVFSAPTTADPAEITLSPEESAPSCHGQSRGRGRHGDGLRRTRQRVDRGIAGRQQAGGPAQAVRFAQKGQAPASRHHAGAGPAQGADFHGRDRPQGDRTGRGAYPMPLESEAHPGPPSTANDPIARRSRQMAHRRAGGGQAVRQSLAARGSRRSKRPRRSWSPPAVSIWKAHRQPPAGRRDAAERARGLQAPRRAARRKPMLWLIGPRKAISSPRPR